MKLPHAHLWCLTQVNPSLLKFVVTLRPLTWVRWNSKKMSTKIVKIYVWWPREFAVVVDINMYLLSAGRLREFDTTPAPQALLAVRGLTSWVPTTVFFVADLSKTFPTSTNRMTIAVVLPPALTPTFNKSWMRMKCSTCVRQPHQTYLLGQCL